MSNREVALEDFSKEIAGEEVEDKGNWCFQLYNVLEMVAPLICL